MTELVGRGDSDWAGHSSTRQSVTVCHCNSQGVMLRNTEINGHQSQFL